MPVPVAGNLTFADVSAGNDGFACGVTTDGGAYCWGENSYGQLGDGTTTNSSVPVKVAGQP
jgi:alpha-tubulin suppressor-like RCC1 family protein